MATHTPLPSFVHGLGTGAALIVRKRAAAVRSVLKCMSNIVGVEIFNEEEMSDCEIFRSARRKVTEVENRTILCSGQDEAYIRHQISISITPSLQIPNFKSHAPNPRI